MFTERFGDDKGMTLVVLNPDDVIGSSLDWSLPLKYKLVIGHVGDEVSVEAAKGPEGTLANVCGKLRFVLRNYSDSVFAETAYAYIRPGDFPWEGAGIHLEFFGGVSGLAKEEDWEMYCLCIDKLVELLSAVNEAAMKLYFELDEAGKLPENGGKYFIGINVGDQFPEWRAAT